MSIPENPEYPSFDSSEETTDNECKCIVSVCCEEMADCLSLDEGRIRNNAIYLLEDDKYVALCFCPFCGTRINPHIISPYDNAPWNLGKGILKIKVFNCP